MAGGLVVMVEDSQSKGREFKSQQHIYLLLLIVQKLLEQKRTLICVQKSHVETSPVRQKMHAETSPLRQRIDKSQFYLHSVSFIDVCVEKS